MKYLRNTVLLFVVLYVATLGLIAIDVYDSRPVLSLFKKLQSNSALEVVDFSIEKPQIQKARPAPNVNRNPYYGDLHVHTKYSFDAYVFGVTASPDDAYRYAKGASIKHPLGYEMQLREPLDFYACLLYTSPSPRD